MNKNTSLVLLAFLAACGGAAGTATPLVAIAPPPTAKPTATPTAKATATPTVAPTATPTVAPTATPTVAPTATPADRLYVAGAGATANTIAYFTAPFSAASTATSAITTTSAQISGMVVDSSGNLIASDLGASTVTGYTRPTPTTSTTFAFTAGALYDMAFDSAAHFYVSQASAISTAPTPLSNSTTFTPLTTIGLTSPWGIAFDSANTMYVANYTSAQVVAYQSPYTSAPFATISTGGTDLESIVFDKATNQVIAVLSSGALVYNLPLTNSSTPIATIPSTFFFMVGAIDTAGDLFVSTAGNTIQVFHHPFSNASTPQFSFPVTHPGAAMTFGT